MEAECVQQLANAGRDATGHLAELVGVAGVVRTDIDACGLRRGMDLRREHPTGYDGQANLVRLRYPLLELVSGEADSVRDLCGTHPGRPQGVRVAADAAGALSAEGFVRGHPARQIPDEGAGLVRVVGDQRLGNAQAAPSGRCQGNRLDTRDGVAPRMIQPGAFQCRQQAAEAGTGLGGCPLHIVARQVGVEAVFRRTPVVDGTNATEVQVPVRAP